MNSETKIYQIPEFTGEHIPVKEAARIMGKDMPKSIENSGLAVSLKNLQRLVNSKNFS